jgi:molybdopterin-guanine dinucleotide biosynthesis protein A
VDGVAYAAVVLAGGAARRLGGVVKPALPVAGRSMLERVLAAVTDASPRVVVGPAGLPLPPGVVRTREQPPGGGPVAGAAAGVAVVPDAVGQIALLAGDLPLLDVAALNVLRAVLERPEEAADVALFVDGDGRRQNLCAVWRGAALRGALARLTGPSGAGPGGASMRALLGGVRVAEVSWTGAGPPPWFDCDTDADLRDAEKWVR